MIFALFIKHLLDLFRSIGIFININLYYTVDYCNKSGDQTVRKVCEDSRVLSAAFSIWGKRNRKDTLAPSRQFLTTAEFSTSGGRTD